MRTKSPVCLPERQKEMQKSVYRTVIKPGNSDFDKVCVAVLFWRETGETPAYSGG